MNDMALKTLVIKDFDVLYDGDRIGMVAIWLDKDILELCISKETMSMRKEIPANKREHIISNTNEIKNKLIEMGFQINE